MDFLKIKDLVPKSIRKVVWRRILHPLAYFIFYSGNKRYCPVCGKSSRLFLEQKSIIPSRKDARCFYCGSLERHRVLQLFFDKTNFLASSPMVLHVAPEHCFETKFKELLGNKYITADLYSKNVMVKMDITNIEYPDETFDIIICSGVLDVVADDKRALDEFFRVATKHGSLVLVVATTESTLEYSSMMNDEDRLRIFGSKFRLRSYCNQDIMDKLRSAGFNVNIINACDLANDSEIKKMSLVESSGIFRFSIFYCTK
jgi:SAM-dependent methyltransferase